MLFNLVCLSFSMSVFALVPVDPHPRVPQIPVDIPPHHPIPVDIPPHHPIPVDITPHHPIPVDIPPTHQPRPDDHPSLGYFDPEPQTGSVSAILESGKPKLD
jgi:hypothetical protein